MKIKNIKKIFILVFGLLVIQNVTAQISEDSNHEFYKKAQKWNISGIVENLPPLRPYPLNVIKEILIKVIENGDEVQKADAEEFWKEVTGKPFNLYFDAKGNNEGKNLGVSLFGAAQGDIDLLNNYVSVGYKLGFNGYTKDAVNYFKKFNPENSNLQFDTLQDPARVGPLYGYLNANESIAIGNTRYFFQMGINRPGYGDFIGNQLALNEGAYHNANMSFTILQDKWNFSHLYSAIGASKAFDGTGLQNNKYLTFHQIEFNITPKISLAYYETIVFGKRFDFSYIIPAPYMAIQGLGGCDDNLQMGIRFNYKPISGLLWANDLYVDDISFNDLVKFDFDTKIRIAATTGLIYSFKNDLFDLAKLNYTLITPYTYSHWDFSDASIDLIDNKTYSYQNYTNNGISMGIPVPPNSDVIKFELDFTPVKKLNMTIDFGFMRHGNIAESLPDEEAMYFLLADENVFATDGSIFNHTFYPKKDSPDDNSAYLDSAWNSLNLLNQKHKMYVFQVGFTAEYTLPATKFGEFSLKLGYKAEYIKNKGVDSNLYKGGLVVDNKDGTYTYENINYENSEVLIEKIKSDWALNLSDIFNNYLSFGFEWKF